MRARLLLGAAALCMAGFAEAQWWDPSVFVKPSDQAPPPFVYKRKIDIDRASTQVQKALLTRDFAKVERMHDEFLALQQAGGNGRWMLESVKRGFGAAVRLAQDRAQVQSLIAGWKESVPDSKLRPSFEAEAWMASGWSHRGNDYASTVSPEAMKLFREDHVRAMKVLKDSEGKGKESPLWYAAALSIAGVTEQPSSVLDAIFNEGTARYPLYLPLYSTRLNFLLPQWGGDFGQVDEFIRRTVLHTQATEGTALYATLYSGVRRSMEAKDFSAGTKLSWNLMRHAFEDGIVLDGEREWLNTYATFACIAEDRITLRRLLKRLGAQADLGLGIAGVSPDLCTEMARE